MSSKTFTDKGFLIRLYGRVNKSVNRIRPCAAHLAARESRACRGRVRHGHVPHDLIILHRGRGAKGWENGSGAERRGAGTRGTSFDRNAGGSRLTPMASSFRSATRTANGSATRTTIPKSFEKPINGTWLSRRRARSKPAEPRRTQSRSRKSCASTWTSSNSTEPPRPTRIDRKPCLTSAGDSRPDSAKEGPGRRIAKPNGSIPVMERWRPSS